MGAPRGRRTERSGRHRRGTGRSAGGATGGGDRPLGAVPGRGRLVRRFRGGALGLARAAGFARPGAGPGRGRARRAAGRPGAVVVGLDLGLVVGRAARRSVGGVHPGRFGGRVGLGANGERGAEAEDLAGGLAAGLDDARGAVVAGGDALERQRGGVHGAGDHRVRADEGEALEGLDLAADGRGLGDIEEAGEGEADGTGALGEIGAGVEERVEDGLRGVVVVHDRSVAGCAGKGSRNPACTTNGRANVDIGCGFLGERGRTFGGRRVRRGWGTW